MIRVRMTLDLTKYCLDALNDLQTRIEEEKTKRERKVPFEVFEVNPSGIQIITNNGATHRNIFLRLTAESKLRAAGGGGFIGGERDWALLFRTTLEDVCALKKFSTYQGVIYFQSEQQALSAYATLTPDEQAAIFGFGEG